MRKPLDGTLTYDRIGNVLNNGDIVLYSNNAKDSTLRIGSVIFSTNPYYKLKLQMRGTSRGLYLGLLNDVVKITLEQAQDYKNNK